MAPTCAGVVCWWSRRQVEAKATASAATKSHPEGCHAYKASVEKHPRRPWSRWRGDLAAGPHPLHENPIDVRASQGLHTASENRWLAVRRRRVYPDSTAMNRVYLDHNATTAVEPEVLDAMLPYLSGEYGNAASIHTFGQKARAAVETAREQVATLIGARPQEIVFTSGGTEADNHAIFGVAQPFSAVLRDPGGVTASKHLITTAIEHEAVLNTCQALEKRGVEVTYFPVHRQGLVSAEGLREALRKETVLITVMHANNELGTVQPLEEIGRIAADADVYFHTDAVQSAGKLSIDVNAFRLDLLSLSGHKFYAPKGVGALYIRGGTRLQQLLYGGHHQRGFRPGTENVFRLRFPARIPPRHGKRSRNCRLGQSRAACREATRGRYEARLSFARPFGAGPAFARAACTCQRRARPAHSQHHTHHVSANRRRSPGPCARSQRACLFHRRCMLLGGRRTLARADRHRSFAGGRSRQFALQPRTPHDACRDRFCIANRAGRRRTAPRTLANLPQGSRGAVVSARPHIAEHQALVFP